MSSEPDALARVRAEIDALDRRLVALLADRQRLVRRAGSLKRDAEEVRAPARRRAMMTEREVWAREEGLDEEVVAGVFTAMIDAFVALELREYAERSR
jgi:isochorismate pyruvate lyase